MNKVILISIDGLRPDGLKTCENPYVAELEKICAYTYSAASVFPPVTLPCHYTMAYSVSPEVHGISGNTYIAPEKPRVGIFERVRSAGGTTAMFYGWEELRDIACPGALIYSTYIHSDRYESVDTTLTDEALKLIRAEKPEFVFLYMVDTDDKGGHHNNWMSAEYLRRASIAIDNVKRIIEEFGDEYTVVIMSDHGGHDDWHGSNVPEDMTVPFMIYGKDVAPGEIKKEISLLDIAPTIAHLMGIEAAPEWEGSSVI